MLDGDTSIPSSAIILAAGPLIAFPATIGLTAITGAGNVVSAARTPGMLRIGSILMNGLDGQTITHSSLEALREGHATRQLRAAIDTYRLLENRWPDRLDDLAARGLVPASTLATPEGRPYYLAHRRDGLILLAPEH